jgi:hypothetical protein
MIEDGRDNIDVLRSNPHSQEENMGERRYICELRWVICHPPFPVIAYLQERKDGYGAAESGSGGVSLRKKVSQCGARPAVYAATYESAG